MKLKTYTKPKLHDYSVDSQILLIAQSPPIGEEDPWGFGGDEGGNKSTTLTPSSQSQNNASPFRSRISGSSPFE